MILAMGTANASMITVITTPMMMNSMILAPMILPPSSALPSPIFLPRRIVVPMAIPTTKAVTSCISQLPVETADTSAAWANCPTTSMSTAPYMVCRKIAASTGRANLTSGIRIFPFVKFCP